MNDTRRDGFDDPLTEQREMRELHSRETRYPTIQCLLGDPHHLPSLFLRGVPITRAVYEEARKSENVERHETAPRSALPEAVNDALAFDEFEATAGQKKSGSESTRER